MAAKRLARTSGMDYAILSGGDVAPLGGNAVTQASWLLGSEAHRRAAAWGGGGCGWAAAWLASCTTSMSYLPLLLSLPCSCSRRLTGRSARAAACCC